MDDIFELFSDDFFPCETKSKKEKKEAKGITKETVYDLPLGIICDGRTYELTSVLAGKGQVTMKELQAGICKMFPWYPEDISHADLDESKKVAYVTYKNHGTQKGELQMGEGDVLRVMGNEMDVSNLVNPEGATIEVSIIQEAIKKEHPECYADNSPLWKQISVLRSDKAGMLVAIMPPDPVQAIPVGDTLKFVPPGEIAVEISRERQMKTIQERDIEGADELTVAELETILGEEGLTLNKQLTISKTNTNRLYYLLSNVSVKNSVATSKPKAELYPTVDTILSVYYAKYHLSPADFGGKEKVDKNALLSFLVEKGHKEYGYCDVRVNYVTKGKMILVSAVGSSKGHMITAPLEDFLEMETVRGILNEHGEDFIHERIERDGIQYHLVDTPMYTTIIPDGETSQVFYLDWKLPRIPAGIFAQGEYVSRYVFKKYHSEVCMDLYFSRKSREYVWNIPNQVVTGATAQTITDPFLETTELSGLIKVGQAHSHGQYPAFFSMVDDRDENTPGIYGVWGSVQNEMPEFKLRLLVFFRRFITLQANTIFETDRLQLIEEDRRMLHQKVERHICRTAITEPRYYVVGLDSRKLLLINAADADVYRKCQGIHVYDIYGEGIEYAISESPQNNTILCLLSLDKLDVGFLSEVDIKGKLEPTQTMMSILDFVG